MGSGAREREERGRSGVRHTSRVPIGKDKLAAVLDHRVHAVQDLEEQVHQLHRVLGAALAAVHARQVVHVAVVCLVQVLSVPAGLEVDLRSQTVLALGAGHTRSLGHRNGVKACKGDTVSDGSGAFICKVLGVIRSGSSIAREHAESGGERFDVDQVIATIQVVDRHAIVLDILERAICVLVIELRRPVCRLVRLNLARGACRLSQVIVRR